MSLPQCQNYAPNDSTANAGNMAADVLEAIGGDQGCQLEQNSYSTTGNGRVGVLTPGGAGYGDFEWATQANELKKSGCQVTNAVIGNYLNSVYQARCAIKSDKTCLKTSIVVDQSANVTASGAGSKIGVKSCPAGIEWRPTSKIDATIVNSISKTTAEIIANVVQAGMENTAAQVQKIEEGFQGTSSGGIMLSDINSTMRTAIQDNSINETVTEACLAIDVKQSLNYTAVAGAVIDSLPCIWTPDSALDLQVANIVSSAYSSQITDSIGQFLKSDQSNEQSVISEGAPNAVLALLQKNMVTIIAVAVIVALIAGVYIYSGNNKGPSSKKSGAGFMDKISSMVKQNGAKLKFL